MNLKKPSAELDLEVANAIGYHAYYGNPFPSQCFLKGGRQWKPSDDWNDAMEAAEKVGLFDKYYITKCCTDVSRWWLFSASRKPICSALTGPLAICAAILKTPKGNPDADEND